MEQSKRCTTCKAWLPLSQFYPKTKNGTKLRPECKGCISRKASERVRTPAYRERIREKHARKTPEELEAHKERARDYHLRQKYGMTNDDFLAMVASQDGDCGICGAAAATHIDHDHKTGSVRMVLCNQCNQLLGFAREEPFILQAAIDYLHAHA